MKMICLAFLSHMSQNTPPPSMDQMLRDRARIQLESVQPQIQIEFAPFCTSDGDYFYHNGTLVFQHSQLAQGSIRFSTDALLSGKKIEVPMPSHPPLPSEPIQSRPASSESSWIWAVAAVAIGGVTWWALSANLNGPGSTEETPQHTSSGVGSGGNPKRFSIGVFD